MSARASNSLAAAFWWLPSERALDPALTQWLQRTERKCPTKEETQMGPTREDHQYEHSCQKGPM